MVFKSLFLSETDTSGNTAKSQQNVITIEPLPQGVDGEVSKVVNANGQMSDTSDSQDPSAGNTDRPAVNGPSAAQPTGATPIQVAVTIEPTPPPSRTNESSSGQSSRSATTDKTSAATEGDTQGQYTDLNYVYHEQIMYLENCGGGGCG